MNLTRQIIESNAPAATIPILLGHGFWGFNLRELSSYGFWSMAHESRTDFAMLLGSVFLLIVGSGPWALDGRLAQRLQQ